jgi:hypothetical protein
MTVLKKILKIAASLLLVVLMSALGGVIGVYLGGNIWVDFALFGVRGYEAVGLVGLAIGLGGGALLAWKTLLSPPEE